MRAKMLINMAGDPMLHVGDLVEGEEAVRLVEAGYAKPIAKPIAKRTATKKSPSKETR